MGVQFFGRKFYKCLNDDNVRLPIEIVNDKSPHDKIVSDENMHH